MHPTYTPTPGRTVAAAILLITLTVSALALGAGAMDDYEELVVTIDADFHHLGDHFVPTYQPQNPEGTQYDTSFTVAGEVENPAIRMWMRGQVPSYTIAEEHQIELLLNGVHLGYLNEYATGNGSIYATEDESEVEVSIEEGVLRQGVNDLTIITGWGTYMYDRDDIMFWNVRLVRARPIEVMCELLAPEPGSAANAAMDLTTLDVLVWNDKHVDALQWVTVTVDPGGADVTFRWTQRTNVMQLEPGAKAHADFTGVWGESWKDIKERTWELLADMTFKWSFPTEGPVDVRVVVRDDQTRIHVFTFEDVLTVRARLALSGPVQARSDDRPVGPGSWVRGGSELALEVPPVIYAGSPNVRPAPGTATIVIWWEGGEVARGAPSDGGVWSVTLTMPMAARVSVVVSVGLVDLPEGARGPLPVLLPLEVDGRAPVFLSVSPSGGAWLRDGSVEIGARITDGDGAGVDAFKVQWQAWPAGADDWGEWTSAAVVPSADGSSLEAVAYAELPEGRGSRVRWRAVDLLGNGPALSPEVSVDVDSTPVRVVAAGDEGWHRDGTAALSCVVTDPAGDAGVPGSGVVPASVEWRVLNPGASDWTAWASAPVVVETGPAGSPRTSVSAEALVPLEEGLNLVMWRAVDAAGNAVVASDPIEVWADLTPPRLVESSPQDVTFPRPEDVVFAVALEDEGPSGVDAGSIEFSLSAGSLDEWGPWVAVDPTDVQGGVVRAAAAANVTGHDNWVRWRGTDVAGNGPVEWGPFKLAVNLPPEARISLPLQGSKHSSEDSVSMSAQGSTDPDPGDVLVYEWWSDIDGLVGTGPMPPARLSPGVHTLTLRVDDGLGGDHVSTATVVVEVIEPAPRPRTPLPSWLFLLVIVAVVAGVIGHHERKRRRARAGLD